MQICLSTRGPHSNIKIANQYNTGRAILRSLEKTMDLKWSQHQHQHDLVLENAPHVQDISLETSTTRFRQRAWTVMWTEDILEITQELRAIICCKSPLMEKYWRSMSALWAELCTFI